MKNHFFGSKFHADNFAGWEKVKIRDHSHDVSLFSEANDFNPRDTKVELLTWWS